MNPVRVYIDIENTITVPFLSGIQRVTRELVKHLIQLPDERWNFIPVRYCPECRGWLHVQGTDILKPTPAAQNGIRFSKISRKAGAALLPRPVRSSLMSVYKNLTHPAEIHAKTMLPKFEEGSVFLDMDSSWHNALKRSELLPGLREQDVRIATVHYDAIPILFPELTHDNTVRVFEEHFYAHVNSSDLFICITKAVEKDLLSIIDSQSEKSIKTATIRLGEFIPSCTNVDWPLPMTPRRYLLYVATIEARKNHAVLLDVFDRISREFDDISLVLVGRKGWHADHIIARISGHKLFNSRIFWLENLSDDSLQLLYRKAYLCISTSLYEGFGLPIVEGLCNKCVSIVSNRGSLPETGKDHVDYFDPEDADELYANIEGYLRDQNAHSAKKKLLSSRNPYQWSTTALDLANILARNLP